MRTSIAPPTKTKRRLLVASVAAAAVAALVWAGAVLGADGTAATPTGPGGEPQAAAPLAGYAPASGAPLADAAIAKIAASRASAAGDDAATMSAVNSTFAGAMSAEPGGAELGTSEGIGRLASSEVVVVTMRGHFTLGDAAVPRGRSAPTGSVLTLVVDAHTGWVDARGLSASVAPGIAALGRARTLR